MGITVMKKAELVDKMVTVLNDTISGKPVPSVATEIMDAGIIDISIDRDDLMQRYKEKYGKELEVQTTPKLTFTNCVITNCTFTNMNLSSSIFMMCKIKSCKFDSCALSGVGFIHSLIDDLKINNSKLIQARFLFTEINNSDISCSDLTHSGFRHVIATESDFREVEFAYSEFTHSVLYECDLYDCKMRYIQFISSTLSGSRLIGTTKLDKTNAIEKLTLTRYPHNELPIKNHFISINNIGSRSGTTYYDYENDRVICGCWSSFGSAFEVDHCYGGPLEEFEKRVKEVYPFPLGVYHDEYMNAIAIFKAARKRYLDSKKG